MGILLRNPIVDMPNIRPVAQTFAHLRSSESGNRRMALDGTHICPMCGTISLASADHCAACGEVLLPGSYEETESPRRPRWITNPSRRVKLTIAGGTIWSVAYSIFCLALFGIGISIEVRTGSRVAILEDSFWIIIPIHIATIVINFALLAFHAIYLFRTPRFKTRHWVAWMLLFFLFGPFSMLPFFVLHIWPTGTQSGPPMPEVA